MRNAGDAWNRESAAREVLGYANYSQGKADARFQRNINEFYRDATSDEPWSELHRQLRETLAAVRGTEAAFRDASQAEAVLAIVFERLLPAYRRHHADLLGHLSDRELYQPFLLARIFEAALAEGGPWDETERIVRGTLQRLNDFVGYRPVAVLERKKCEPYDHEWVRPIPLYIRGAGVAVGRVHDIVTTALTILEQTDANILSEADFSLELLDELALDPRAYDFGHPVNQRPNYQFGEWDPHCIDNQGRYRRFVVRQVVLEALLDRVQGSEVRGQESGVRSQESDDERVEDGVEIAERGAHASGPQSPARRDSEQLSTLTPQLLFEAAAVLAGTMLMASGTSGSGPEAHDSSVTLATLVPKIARYRDVFYESLIKSVGGPHGERLRQESQMMRQPFGGARQHLNQYLARQRAAQLQHTHLARLFAEMGYPDASRDQSRLVATASARTTTELECSITASHMHLDRGELPAAVKAAEPVEDLLHRGISCGAIVDPWNILGFQGQFSIFPAIENAVPDPRVDQITEVIELTFTLFTRLLAEAAAAGDETLETGIKKRFQQLASWWDQFATVEVGGVDHVHGQDSFDSAIHVARSLAAWHGAGEAAGDIRFWREHSEGFTSPRAFAQVIDALLEKEDYVATMALLISWLSQVDQIPLEQGPHSFHELAGRWLRETVGDGHDSADRSARLKRFFDYLEANAEEYWLVPGLELGKNVSDLDEPEDRDADEEDSDDGGTFSAAYEGVTFRDTAADGHEGELLEGGPATGEFELEAAAERIEPRLQFLTTLAALWQLAAPKSLPLVPPDLVGDEAARETGGPRPAVHPEQFSGADDCGRVVESWLRQLHRNERDLERLIKQVQDVAVPQPTGSHDSLVEYDRRRSIKENLIYAAIATQVETNNAARRLMRCLRATPADVTVSEWAQQAVELERAMVRGHVDEVRFRLPQLLEKLANVPLLYRRVDKGGDARAIVAARCVQQTLRVLVESLPRVGLLREAYRAVHTARDMEQQHPVGEGITEFDHLFRAALGAVVESVLDAATDWTPYEQADGPLLECLEELTEPFMKLWLEHSQSVRLSVLDRVRDDAEWQAIQKFIEHYGHDLLTPAFLTFGNLRAILDNGVGRFLDYLAENPDPLHPVRLIDDLDRQIRRADAERLLDLIIHVFVENYEEYKDYNSTTTQSDYGERYFILFEFLRVKAWYERTSWNLEPVGIVHEVLARKGRGEAAYQWQEALSQKTAGVAETLLQKLAGLEKQFGVRMASVRDRLGERFTRPLALDRIRILIEPAVEEARRGEPSADAPAFRRFQETLGEFAETTTGVGLDVPEWLRVLEEEVDRVRADRERGRPRSSDVLTDRRPIFSRADVEKQMADWDQPL